MRMCAELVLHVFVLFIFVSSLHFASLRCGVFSSNVALLFWSLQFVVAAVVVVAVGPGLGEWVKGLGVPELKGFFNMASHMGNGMDGSMDRMGKVTGKFNAGGNRGR
jgi:hypothetical protein